MKKLKEEIDQNSNSEWIEQLTRMMELYKSEATIKTKTKDIWSWVTDIETKIMRDLDNMNSKIINLKTYKKYKEKSSEDALKYYNKKVKENKKKIIKKYMCEKLEID